METARKLRFRFGMVFLKKVVFSLSSKTGSTLLVAFFSGKGWTSYSSDNYCKHYT